MPSNIEELKKIEKILPILLTDKVKRKLLSLITSERKKLQSRNAVIDEVLEEIKKINGFANNNQQVILEDLYKKVKALGKESNDRK
jgi:hypothetical protein